MDFGTERQSPRIGPWTWASSSTTTAFTSGTEPDFVFISRGPDGSWDQGGLIHGQGYEQVDDETFIYYGHWDLRLGTNYRPRGGLGL